MNSHQTTSLKNKIVWGTADCSFGLSSSHPQVLEEARRVFSPWSRLSDETDLDWRVEPNPRGWSVRWPDYLETQTVCKLDLKPHHSSLPAAVRSVEFQAIAAHLYRKEAPLVLHGALLQHRGKGVGIVGLKEAGKSTLAASQWLRGWSLLSDDGFYRNQDTVSGVPRRIRLRPEARPLLADLMGDPQRKLPGETIDEGHLLFHPSHTDPIRLDRLLILSPEPGPLQRLETSEAMLKLVTFGNFYWMSGINSALGEISRLLTDVECYTLGRASLETQYERLATLV